ncbi:MAG TPA: hybrid sensor histidine kinase/response regulator [Ktedonobacteraceae bacterium]|nr:hybrid sensor histidine kinase/response regulator [Ktedonobacteraceae bacterium]
MDTTQILLVDDDLALLQALPHTISLRMSGVEVEIADSAEDALKLIQEHDYDTIVSDIKMPGMDGLDLLAHVSTLYPDTPVILITGHGEHDLAIQALRGGAYDYIQKPIDRDSFIAALHRALQTRQLRRQVQEQQRALERYALSLERLVEQRTHELVVANVAKDRSLSMVVHELSSPLTSLIGIVQLLRLQLQRADAMQRVSRGLTNMEQAIRRMKMLIHDLQDTSLIQTNHFTLHRGRCNLYELCRQVLDEYASGNGDRPTFEAFDASLEVECDKERICQVLTNLLSNARKYSPEGAPISVTLRRGDGEAIIAVRDCGVGIPEDQLSLIYEQFYRVPDLEVQHSSSASGLGLGLYIARNIVEQHGGRIEVQSSPGNGSTFSVMLPLSD